MPIIKTTTIEALKQAESLLEKRAGVFAALSRTTETIPKLLARAQDAQADVSTSAQGKLDDIERQRAAQVRLRHASVEQLLGMEDSLRECRASIDSARESYAASAVRELQTRYAEKVRELQQLWAEGDQLAGALRAKVDLPLPVRLKYPDDKQGRISYRTEEQARPKLERVAGVSDMPVIDPHAARLGSALDALDKAIQFCSGVRENRERELKLQRAPAFQGFDAGAVYMVIRELGCYATGEPFKPGALIDRSLVGPAHLARLFQAKSIRRATQAATQAA
jgi:hypothetical protein